MRFLRRPSRPSLPPRYLRRLLAASAILATCAGTAAASAMAEEGTPTAVSFPGSPMTVYVGPLGQCQTSYPNFGNNFFSPTSPIGDCGLFLGFPNETGRPEQPKMLQGKTFGFGGSAGPGLLNGPTSGEYTAVSHSPVTGAGTAASPFTQTTVFDVVAATSEVLETPKTYAEIAETTTYVNGEPQFVSTYVVKNVSGAKLYFRAVYAGDLYVSGSDYGVGLFLGGPPAFIGGQNTSVGVLGGFIQAGPPSPPWSAFQEGCWNEATAENPGRCSGASAEDAGIWHLVREAATTSSAHLFNNTIDPAFIDNGAGVEWDEHMSEALANGASATYSVINRTQVPGGLQIVPPNQTLVQGQTATISVTSQDTAGQPFAGKVLRYSVSGANTTSGAVTLNAAGQGQISYVGANAGIDTIQMYVDLAGNAIQEHNDPSGTASVTFTPPAPNGNYTIRSIRANANGTITIVFVPVQSGTATVEVTVPTGTIARHRALAAARRRNRHAARCKRGQVKIKRRCRPRNSVVGKVTAAGTAGVPLTITVPLSSQARKALGKGKTLHVLARLIYKSKLGGTPSVHTYHVTVRGKRHKKRKRH